ncbi:precorrin-6A reductase [Lactobacillus sp. XV13L]|nr:precorrin-6A reductase [Lactobacillus sp. XV13L]
MILLLGGTSESLEIADILNRKKLNFVLSVVSEYGNELSHQHAKYVVQQILTADNFKEFCKKQSITYIIDATHPFAREISQLAIDQSVELRIPYLRFERESVYSQKDNVRLFNSTIEVYSYLKKQLGTIYLSTGSKTANEYAENLGVERLHIRALPTIKVLEKLTRIGFSANQIDAIQGPFSQKLNEELFIKANASWVITKESGSQGGLMEKLTACQHLNIPCIIIRRPQIDYPEQVSTLSELEMRLGEEDVW